MKKNILLVIFSLFILTSCFGKDNKEKITLDDKFYGNNEYIEIESDYLENEPINNYVIFVHNSFCSLRVPCQNIFKQYMEKYNISFLSINIDEYKKTYLYEKVKYAPSVIVVSEGKVIAYLDAEKDEDLDKYQDLDEFDSWINKYIINNK